MGRIKLKGGALTAPVPPALVTVAAGENFVSLVPEVMPLPTAQATACA